MNKILLAREREGIYFFHIPKTAGMSVWRFLEQMFHGDKTARYGGAINLIVVPRHEVAGWDVFRVQFCLTLPLSQ
jgi:hypothetical protein